MLKNRLIEFQTCASKRMALSYKHLSEISGKTWMITLFLTGIFTTRWVPDWTVLYVMLSLHEAAHFIVHFVLKMRCVNFIKEKANTSVPAALRRLSKSV